MSCAVSHGTGGGVGKADFAPLAFSHFYDKASPVLFRFCAAGKHITKVLISVCKAGGKQEEFLRITLSDVVLTHVEPGGTSGRVMVSRPRRKALRCACVCVWGSEPGFAMNDLGMDGNSMMPPDGARQTVLNLVILRFGHFHFRSILDFLNL
jgi:hypothetical protein